MNKKFTKETLQKYKIDISQEKKQEQSKNVIIKVGTGTCGIAAGADKVYNYIKKEIENRGMKNIIVKQTGCMGLCFSEPNVEVIMNDMPDVVYGRVNEKVAKRILEDHIMHNTLVDNRIYEKPATDIIVGKEENQHGF